MQGIGAINAVGKAAVQVANTLDHAVEQLFEGWTSPAGQQAAGGNSDERVTGCKGMHSEAGYTTGQQPSRHVSESSVGEAGMHAQQQTLRGGQPTCNAR